jgi:gluconolactonase
MDIQGVYRITPNGESLFLEISDFQTPNGLALSPNEDFIYVDDTDRMEIRRFEVSADGSLGNGIVFATLDQSVGTGWPDGLKTDTLGNVYATGPGGLWIIGVKGELLGVLKFPEPITNLNWGGSDSSWLYLTTATENFSRSSLYRMPLRVRGHLC